MIYKFINNNTGLSKEEDVVVKFGIDMVRTAIIAFIISIIVSILMGVFYRAIFFLMLIVPLRQYSGGFHTKHRWTCGIISLIVYVLSLLTIKMFDINFLIQILIVCISSIIIIEMAPVDNKNNELTESEKLLLSEKNRKIMTVELVIFMFLFIMGFHDWSKVVALVMGIVGVLVIAGSLKNMLGD